MYGQLKEEFQSPPKKNLKAATNTVANNVYDKDTYLSKDPALS